MENKDLIIFDLDGTLAPSKSPLEPDMADLLVKLIEKRRVVVISGGNKTQLQKQFLDNMPKDHPDFKNLVLMPTSGARMQTWNGEGWTENYAEVLTKEEKEKIINALNASLDEIGLNDPDIIYGPPIIEDRETEVTFSGLGQGAPVDAKSVWDPERVKRKAVIEILKKRIPEFNIYIGGATSIDVTHQGVNKAFAIRKLEEILQIPISKMVFIGDSLFEGGNDYPARSTGVECIAVKDPEETKELIKSWLNA